MSDTDMFKLDLSTGKSIPLRAIKAQKTGNTFWATLNKRGDGTRYYGRYGVNVPGSLVGGALPTFVEFQGQRYTLEHDVTDKSRGRAKGSFKVKVDGKEKQLSVRFTELEEGNFNINCSVNGVGGGGAKNVISEL